MIYLRKIAAETEVFSFGQFGSFILLSITRSPAQKPACKDLSRNGQRPAITAKAAYTPTSNRAGSRSGGFLNAKSRINHRDCDTV